MMVDRGVTVSRPAARSNAAMPATAMLSRRQQRRGSTLADAVPRLERALCLFNAVSGATLEVAGPLSA